MKREENKKKVSDWGKWCCSKRPYMHQVDPHLDPKDHPAELILTKQ